LLVFSLLLIGGIAASIFYIILIKRRLARDLADRKQSEQREKTRNHVLELLAHGAPLATILGALVRGVEQERPDMLCSIMLLDSEGKHLLNGAAPSLPDFYNDVMEGFGIGVGAGSFGTTAFTGQRVIVEDVQTHPYWAPYRELTAKAGLGACWSEPIRSASGKVLGTFAIYHRQAHQPDDEEIRLIEQTAIQAVQPHLAPGQATVGTRVDIAHLAATPVGMTVTITVELTEIDRRRLGFRVEVRDELDEVGKGTHERFIIDGAQRMPRLEDKLRRWKAARA